MFIFGNSPLSVHFSGIMSAAILCGCAAETQPVSFQADVKPILEARCVECHMPGTEGYEASGLRLDSYEALMRGTRFGPVVVPGDSLTSALNILIEDRADPSISMPHNQWKLNQDQIETMAAWVNQGAKNN